jgi:glucose-6-phosphate isomerase
VSVFAAPPISPMRISFDPATAAIEPAGPVLTRRMSDLEGLFTGSAGWKRAADGDDPVVYTVHSSPVPERSGANSPSRSRRSSRGTAAASST